MNFIKYNPKLKSFASNLRKNSTKFEIEMWKFLKANYSEYKFLRQKPLEEFIVDFYCASKKIIIEVDGEVHNKQTEKDEERDNLFYLKYKVKTIRFTNEVVMSNKNYLRKILDEALH